MEKIIKLIEENKHLYEILKNCPFRILKQMDVYHFQQGDVVINQGEVIDRFYIIVEGTANIYVMSENGRVYSQAIYQSGDFIGEIEIFDRYPSVSNVKALSNLTLIGIKVEDFLEWLNIDNHMSYYFNRSLAKYLYNLATKSGVDSLYPLKYRLCNLLLKELEPNRKNKQIIRISKNQISEQLAVTLRSVNRILRELREKKIIQFINDGIKILDIDRLKQERENSMLE
ncbi:Crp/Fnr family transcriptional regulator [Tepidibacillus infernus]|uniref:Crp/Fnr family transcriptional regulator n=1 Tax=Tepidibacillus decaturensis TaxID=1413211 RepID=A0A135L6B4_9BACI|nr:Crp/Fnr family transcriptional regulator [Tepidibacillus decaturensis]KXG44541.1 hypothetical protein U473_11315 [Tepidibacillus decaturensis]